MIQAAGKYERVRGRAETAASKGLPGGLGLPPGKTERRNGVPAGTDARCSAPQIFVPKAGSPTKLGEWFWRELREGGYLQEYLRREKARQPERQRKVAQAMHARPAHLQTEDLRLRAVVDARTYVRWRMVDRNFWDDEGNLKSFLRDNPEAKPVLVRGK